MKMDFELQPNLENDLIKIQPLTKNDFECLYEIASDPIIWEQHPNKDRYLKEKFKIFFKGAIESSGAFLVFNNKTGMPIGCSRFYEYNKELKSVSIGYTFLAKDHWGKGFNRALKSLMINHAFNFVNSISFHIGASNIRSQKAIEKTGAKKTGEIEMEYYGEPKRLNFIYLINKEFWAENRR